MVARVGEQRSRIDIIANVLQAANGGVKKTRIMCQCNLSFRQLHVYLDFLVDMGFLKSTTLKTENNDSQLFETTSKGRAFIQAYRNLRALLSTRHPTKIMLGFYGFFPL